MKAVDNAVTIVALRSVKVAKSHLLSVYKKSNLLLMMGKVYTNYC